MTPNGGSVNRPRLSAMATHSKPAFETAARRHPGRDREILRARHEAQGLSIHPRTAMPVGDLFPGTIRLLTPFLNITGAFALMLGAVFSTYVFMPKRRVLAYSLDPNQSGDPSRSTVNPHGDVISANRQTASATFIMASECPDQDGDGWSPRAGDCDDKNPAFFPGAPDLACDGMDNDCDGLTDGDDPDC